MYFEKRYIQKIERIFGDLSIPVRLFDAQGMCIAPESGSTVDVPGAVMAPGINHHIGHHYYRVLDMHPPLFLHCPDHYEGVNDLMLMTDAMLMNMFKSSLSIASYSDVYRRALKQELKGQDLITSAQEHQIALDINHCVMIFQMEQNEQASAYHMLGELIPLIDTDVLVEMNRSTVALIKDMDGIDGFEDLYQLALAVQETVMEETVQTVEVGIGEVKQTLAQLGEGYLEAQRAMEVGHIFSSGKSIHIFRKLMLERFLMNAPREESMLYHSLLFNRKTAKLFNEEMLQTIEMFFRKDLNLSDTARQLFIHRNTLVYRLDKVQRQTGLDLRHFDDAVTFKMLHELKKCGKEKPKQIV